MFTLKIDCPLTTRPQLEVAIADFLAAQEPATLDEICKELQYQMSIKPTRVLPLAITAIAAMQEQGLICEYKQMPFDDPLDYAWVLAEEQPKPELKPKPGYLHPTEGWTSGGWPA